MTPLRLTDPVVPKRKALRPTGGESAERSTLATSRVRPARARPQAGQGRQGPGRQAGQGPAASAAARRKTVASIAGVSRPVNVFCWLG